MNSSSTYTILRVSESAKQKNASAIQYHFGSRDRLVEAVFEHRMDVINPVRLEMLDALEPGDEASTVRQLVRIWTWPLAEQLRPRPEGNHYLQFLARAAKERELAVQLAPTELMSGWISVAEQLETLLCFLPGQIVEARLLAAGAQCLDGLAHLELDNAGNRSDFELLVENLIDMITAGLLAPISEESKSAQAALDNPQKG